MNLAAVQQIAKAVLYEGYMLYPYRPSSVKNQQRWNFGVLYPRTYSEAQEGSDAWSMQTECLVQGGSGTKIEARVRFLQLVARSVGKISEDNSDFERVTSLAVGERKYQPWQEASEREVVLPARNVDSIAGGAMSHPFEFSGGKQSEFLRDGNGAVAGVIVREHQAIRGEVTASSERVGEGVFKISVGIRNLTVATVEGTRSGREEALSSSLVSTHTVLGVEDGRFISSLDPPESARAAVAALQNTGTWPVLVGAQGEADTVLSSPIILYDYPQIAAESAGDLFDGTEIDEILSLRIMTLTDEEKRELRQSDDRARQMLERTENLPPEQFLKLHGVLRNLRAVDFPEGEVVDREGRREEVR
jgi:hypothetical protein